MIKLLAVLAIAFPTAVSGFLPSDYNLNFNINSKNNIDTNINNTIYDSKKLDISKLEIPTYNIDDFSAINDDVLFEYILSTAASQEQNSTVEQFLNNVIDHQDSNWFILKKVNFKIPTKPNSPIKASLMVRSTDECPLYSGTKFLFFKLEIPKIPAITKDISNIQYFINHDFKSSFTITDFKQKNNDDDILIYIDTQLEEDENSVFGVSGILDLMYTQKALKIDRILNFNPYNDINVPNKRNDFISEYTYILTGTNGWLGTIKINHLTVYEQKLLDFNNWKKAAESYDVLANPGKQVTPAQVYQNDGEWRDDTSKLAWNKFFDLEAKNSNVGVHIFGDKITQSLKDDFYEKYSRFFTLSFECLKSNVENKYSEYEVTIGFNYDEDLPFKNITKNDNIKFTLDLVYNFFKVDNFSGASDLPIISWNTNLFGPTVNKTENTEVNTIGFLKFKDANDIKKYKKLNYSFYLSAINMNGDNVTIDGYQNGVNSESIDIYSLLAAGDKGISYQLAYDNQPMSSHIFWGDEIHIGYTMYLVWNPADKQYNIQVKSNAYFWGRYNWFSAAQLSVGLEFKNQQFYLSGISD